MTIYFPDDPFKYLCDQHALARSANNCIIISNLQVSTTTAFRFQIKDFVPSARKKSRPVVHLRRLLLLLHRLECWAENIVRTLYLCSTKTRYWEFHHICPQDFPIPPEFWWSTNILSSSIINLFTWSRSGYTSLWAGKD